MTSKVLRVAIAAAGWGARLVLLAWLLGRVLSDRYGWSQWLLWIPTPAVIAIAMVGLCAAFRGRHSRRPRPPRRRRLVLWSITIIVLLVYFLGIEHRFLHRAQPDREGLEIVHWNMNARRLRERRQFARTLIDLQADITLLTNNGGVVTDEELQSWLGPTMLPFVMRPFTIISRVPIVELRWLIGTGEIYVLLLVVDAGELIGRNLTIWLFDLPSSPRISRADTADKTARLLSQVTAPSPDLIVGDFNMTRSSHAFSTLTADHRHAFDLAGRGYGATWPRAFPLYHIDHIMVAAGIDISRYELINTGAGQHVLQRVVVSSE